MILGIGCDILEIHRLASWENFRLDRIFTPEERRQAGERASMLAGDFSVKEAVSKCFGTGVRGFGLKDIEVLRDNAGKPYVRLYGNAERIFREMGGKQLHVSISNTKDVVTAFAVLEGEMSNAGDADG